MRSRKIDNRFLDMCETTSATAEAIYTALTDKISQLLDTSKPWHNCTSVNVDNTSASIGIQNSLKTRIITRTFHWLYITLHPYITPV